MHDVHLTRKTIPFRPNEWRGLKTRTSHRPVPLWPQLDEILRTYLLDREREGGLGVLLFPSHRHEKAERMLDNVDRALDRIAERAGWATGEIRTKMFRHTYCAARLQTLDRGAPVSPFTVAKEMGHGGTALVERCYGHLGQVRHRAEEVAYRLEDHTKALAARLRGLALSL